MDTARDPLRPDPIDPTMTQIPPHKTLMLLHRLVDRALAPLLEPMGLEHATEGYVTVTRRDIDALAAAQGDPQAVLAGFGPRATARGLMISEPGLSSAVLSRIWRSDRNEGAPLTHVEGEILRQFLARIVSSWAEAWSDEGVRLLPEFTMAGGLSMLQPQLAGGTWHVARTVVREAGEAGGEPLGVLLFCYPDALMPQLATEAKGTTWRARIDRGLREDERARLAGRLTGPLRHVSITAPVRVCQHMTLGMLNALERGDVVAFDEDFAGEIALRVLDRDVTGRLAATPEGHLALAIGGEEPAGMHDPVLAGSVSGSGGYDAEHDWHHAEEAPPEPDFLAS